MTLNCVNAYCLTRKTKRIPIRIKICILFLTAKVVPCLSD